MIGQRELLARSCSLFLKALLLSRICSFSLFCTVPAGEFHLYYLDGDRHVARHLLRNLLRACGYGRLSPCNMPPQAAAIETYPELLRDDSTQYRPQLVACDSISNAPEAVNAETNLEPANVERMSPRPLLALNDPQANAPEAVAPTVLQPGAVAGKAWDAPEVLHRNFNPGMS